MLVSQSPLFVCNPIREANASLRYPSFAPNPPHNPIFCLLNSRSNQIRIQTQNKAPIVSAKRRGRRRSQARSQNSALFLLDLASLVASNLKVLPQPLDLVLEGIGGDGTPGGGGGGGGIDFWKGFGWEGFDGWRRRRKRKKGDILMYGFAVICVLGFLFGRDIERNAIWWGLGFGPFGIAMIRCWEKIDGVPGWVFLGFCLWSFVVGMTYRREELRKWISRVRVSLPAFRNLRRRKTRRKSGRLF